MRYWKVNPLHGQGKHKPDFCIQPARLPAASRASERRRRYPEQQTELQGNIINICGEIYLEISHDLVSKSGQKVDIELFPDNTSTCRLPVCHRQGSPRPGTATMGGRCRRVPQHLSGLPRLR